MHSDYKINCKLKLSEIWNNYELALKYSSDYFEYHASETTLVI